MAATCRIWGTDDQQGSRVLRLPHPTSELPKRERLLRSVDFAADGSISAADSDGSIWLWCVDNLTEPVAIRGDLLSVGHVRYCGNDQLLATCLRENSVNLLDLSADNRLLWTQTFDFAPECLAVSTDNRLVAVATKGIDIYLLNRHSGERIGTLRGHSETVRCISFLPNLDELVSTGSDGAICLWDIASGTLIRTFTIVSAL